MLSDVAQTGFQLQRSFQQVIERHGTDGSTFFTLCIAKLLCAVSCGVQWWAMTLVNFVKWFTGWLSLCD